MSELQVVEERDCEDQCPNCEGVNREYLGTDYEQEDGFTSSYKCKTCGVEYYEKWVSAGYKYGYTSQN